MRTRIYIDGFNLYYGAVRGTPYKWLNPFEMCKLMLPPIHNIEYIKYFTAPVQARPHDPAQPNRQQLFFRALKTIPNLKIILGNFQSHPKLKRLANPVPGLPDTVVVMITEEKGSDVNLASHLLIDGYKKLFDFAVVVTNDSDLLTPIRHVREQLNLGVGILNPHKVQARQLLNYSTFSLPITEDVLKRSQFPNRMRDAHGEFFKPPEWQ
jgi:hypothetical protein